MKYLVVKVLLDKHLRDIYSMLKSKLVGLEIRSCGEIVYMRFISFLNYIVFNEQYIAQ